MKSTTKIKSADFLSLYSIAAASATLLLIFAGGLVTSHEAGLAVPDWPLSYGMLLPPMVGNIFWEHGHRMIAGAVGLMTLIQAIWIQVKSKGTRFLFEKRNLVPLAWISVAAVVIQALLGGLTVIFLLPPAVSVAHACLAQTFFCLMIAIAYILNENAEGNRFQKFREPGTFSVSVIAFSLLYLQLILGATVRHTGHAIVPHVMGAFITVAMVLLFSFRLMTQTRAEENGLKGLGLGLGILILIQFFLGIGAFIFTRVVERTDYAPNTGEILFTTIHQTTGALILGLMVLTGLILWRR